jgi:hypothetical protein
MSTFDACAAMRPGTMGSGLGFAAFGAFFRRFLSGGRNRGLLQTTFTTVHPRIVSEAQSVTRTPHLFLQERRANTTKV